MSLLTDALGKIQLWLDNNYAECAAQILPGLSIAEIEEFSQALPFHLPQEVHELYQWSSGTDVHTGGTPLSFDRFGMRLYSLQEAAEHANSLRDDNWEECDIRYLGSSLFPIFATDQVCFAVAGTSKPQISSPIIYISELTTVWVSYVSLTSMMQTIAECLETGVASQVSGGLDYDGEGFSAVYRKYNADLPELSISAFCLEIKRLDWSPVRLEQILSSLNEQISFLKCYWEDLSLEHLSPEVRNILTTAATDENELIHDYVNSALEMLTP
jgi:SMI1 / KNR4 family (SUKH-1)